MRILFDWHLALHGARTFSLPVDSSGLWRLWIACPTVKPWSSSWKHANDSWLLRNCTMTNERISFVVIDERNVRASCDRHSYFRSFQRLEKLRSRGSLQGWRRQHSSGKEQANWPKPWSLNVVNRASFLSPNYRLGCRFTVSVTSFYELPALHFLRL